MTLTAPRSRQGKTLFVLAILAALVAVSAALLWSNNAQAQLPLTITELDQDPDGPGTVAPGQTVTYVGTAQITADLPNAGDGFTVQMDVDDDLIIDMSAPSTDVSCNPAATNSGYDVVTGDQWCYYSGPITAFTATMTVTGIADGDGDIDPPTVALACADTNNDGFCDDEAGNDVQALDDDNPVDVGTLTQDASLLATADPASATNPPGTSHVVTFSLAAGVNCASGDDPLDDDPPPDFSCGTGDVTLSCGNSTVDSAVGSDTDQTDPTDVVVTITNDGTEESCTITLALVANDGNDDEADDVPFTASADKEFTLAAVAGELRHLDEPDPATEDAFGDFADGGLLVEMDDPDDAIGSFHQACIVNVLDPASPGLTNADAPDITWSITPIIGATPVAASVTEVAGPNGEACVRWGSGHTGAQQITAVWDNGVAPAVTFFWDAYCIEGDTCYDADDDSTDDVVPLELVKEWNTIDFTKIVAADGDVGDTLDENTGELDLNPSTQRDATLHQKANLDGTTVDVNGVLIIGPAGFGHVDADGQSFVEYVFGAHNDAGGFYSGPVDGVEQTFSVSGDCGSVRLEDPVTGNVIILNPGDSETLLSSDKGIGFEIVPNDEGAIETTSANANCDPSSSLTVSIHSEEHELFRSPPAVVLDPDETITVHWDVGPPANKQPLLLWAGMRQLLEHDWSDANGDCPWGEPFYVRYTIQTGNGALVSDLGDGVAFGPDFMVVQVGGQSQTAGSSGSNPEGANDFCISRVVYESQDEGEQDIVAHVVEPLCPEFFDLGSQGEEFPAGCDWSVISQQVPFLLYYMKFESVTLGLVPGARSGHNSGNFDPTTDPIWDPANDVSDLTSNVSADVLARVRVRGWLVRNNCPVRDAGADSNGSFLPANRCIFPDDWEHIAGGALAEEFRPNYDIMNAPDSAYNCTGTNFLTCNSSEAPGVVGSTVTGHNPVRGPFSLLDGPNPGDSLAPDANGGFRETWLHDGDVDEWDAPMPPALIRFLLTGSGFLRAADKKTVYNNGENPFYETHIPAEPWITPINEDLSGYQWNSWGIGSKSGPYIFWTSLADHGAEVISCPGATSVGCAGGVATGGYKLTRVYTDNHGEAMTYVNGDADLTWDDCDLNTPVPAFNISQLSGYYCEQGDVVGNSTLNAVADYPDKRKHQPIASEDVTITWTWGGIKNVTIEPGAGDGFNYVVFHVSDRDGFCDLTTSLHPVLGELVEFTIDSPNGIIFPDSNGIEAQGPPVVVSANKKFATTHTFAASATECQAWIHVSESQELPVDVIIRAFDPEGTVTFDVLINEPPEPTPTPSPTPAPPPDLWGDIDCDGDVDSVDALGGLRYVAGFFVNQTGPCSDVGGDVTVDGNAEIFGDWDCDGDVDAVDALQILLWVAGLDGDQTPPCPDIGSGVTIT